MINQLTLDESNRGVLVLLQAMLGAISPNFRMISLEKSIDRWKIQFVLESESLDDREEIQAIAEEFESLHNSGVKYDVFIIINTDQIIWPELPIRVAYRRRE